MIETSVLVNGQSVKKYFHKGNTYIEAKEGTEYQLRIKNSYNRRVCAVVSVDGLSVLTGKEASPNDPGYVIHPSSSVRINGFRYDDETEAAFKFTSKGNSYASEKGESGGCNCGVIGIIVYDENYPKFDWTITSVNSIFTNDIYPRKRYFSNSILESDWYDSEITISTSSAFNVQPERSANFDLGTKWGKPVHSKVEETEFVRGVILHNSAIYYASRNALIDMGVPISKERQVHFPQAFPRKYCEPPKYWNK